MSSTSQIPDNMTVVSSTKLIIACVFLLVGGLVVRYALFGPGNESPANATAETGPAASNNAESRSASERENDPSVSAVVDQPKSQSPANDRLASTLKIVRAERLASRADEHCEILDEFRAGLRDWNSEFAAVLQDDRGRLLAAANDDNVAFYQRVKSQTWPTDGQLESWSVALQVLSTELKSAMDSSDSVSPIPDAYEAEIDRIGHEVEQHADELADITDSHELRLSAVMDSEAPKESPTLAVILSRWEEAQRRKRDAVVHSVIEEVQQEERDKLVATTEEFQRDIESLERERVRLTGEAMKQQILAENAKAAEKARLEEVRRQQRLEMQKHMPEIRRYLVPFITAGHRQVDGGQRWKYTNEAVGMSLSALRAVGALRNDRNGYEMFMFVAGGPYNDRPNGVFRETIGGAAMESEIPNISKAQALLEEFGDLLVAEGLLSP